MARIALLLAAFVLSHGCGDDADPALDAQMDAAGIDAPTHDAHAVCGDGTCTADESCASCVEDCGRCVPDTCGNDTCDADEACDTCPGDCGVCPGCGDGTCADTETCTGCEVDCGACVDLCGDGTCGLGESCSLCATDCGGCPGDHAWSYPGVPYPTDPQPLGGARFGWDPSAAVPDTTHTWNVSGPPPTGLACGDVVAMTGTRSDDFELDFDGCDDEPIWFVGAATFAGFVRVSGSNLIIDGPTFRGDDGSLHLRGEMIAVRNAAVIDADEGWGSALFVSGRNIVVFRTAIGPSGDYTLSTEVDHHCVKVGPSTDIWFIESEFSECQGDGMQVGDETSNRFSASTSRGAARTTIYRPAFGSNARWTSSFRTTESTTTRTGCFPRRLAPARRTITAG